jgi:hypothetical protein
VTLLVSSPDVAARVFGAFSSLKDSYPRFVISRDTITQGRDGIRHLRLEDFLLDPPPDLA